LQNASVDVNNDVAISTAILPADATNQSLTWSSSNNNIATVTNGVVRGVAAGSVTITATAQDGSGVSNTCTVTVNAPIVITITGVTISNCPSANLEIGNQVMLSASVQGTGGTIPQSVTWSSGNQGVASVNNGVVMAHAAGQAIIIATSTADPTKSATCTITVNQPQSSVGNIEEDGKTIISYNNTIEIQGIEIGEKVAVYNVLGIKIFSQTATQNPMIISNLQAGIYIVFIENKNISAKVVLR
jgi:uncharacterized protein YjdB